METPMATRAVRARVVFRGPGQQANGLAAAPEGLWLCEQRENLVYLVGYDGGTALTSFRTPTRNGSGIAYGDGSVWVAANVRPSAVYRHDPATGHCLAALILPGGDRGGVHGIEWHAYLPGEPVPAMPAARAQPHPTALGGEPNAGPGVSGTLWVTRPGQRTIQHLDAETGDVLGELPFPAARSHGIYWDEDDGSVVCAETNGNTVYRLDPATGAVRDAWRVEGVEVHGMTRSPDGRVWVCDARTNEIALLEL
jgi:streptogramin lyase